MDMLVKVCVTELRLNDNNCRGSGVNLKCVIYLQITYL